MKIDREPRNPTNLEKKQCIEARFRLLSSRTPELFEWITENYDGCLVTENNGDPASGEWPSISLHGPWSEWNIIGNGTRQEASDASEITVGFNGEIPSVLVTQKHKVRIGLVVGPEQSHSKTYNIDNEKVAIPLVLIAARKVEESLLLNPNRHSENTINTSPVMEHALQLTSQGDFSSGK